MKKHKNIPALRFPGFEGEWVLLKIQKLIDNQSIISHLDGNHGELYPRSEEFADSGIPYITANDFITGNINFNNCSNYSALAGKKCLFSKRACNALKTFSLCFFTVEI